MKRYVGIPSPETFFGVAIVLVVVATGLFIYVDKPELIPQLWTSIIAVFLSYWACAYSAEKLRLDLLDRRFEIYSKTLDYCSVVMSYASLERTKDNAEQIEKAMAAAHESFRGIGYHKTQALFGPDIVELFSRLNNSFAYISTYGKHESRGKDFDAQKYWHHVNETVEIANRLPGYFKKYMYFGDHQQR